MKKQHNLILWIFTAAFAVVFLLLVVLGVVSLKQHLFPFQGPYRADLGCDYVKLGETSYCFKEGDGIFFRNLSRNDFMYGGRYKGTDSVTGATIYFSSKIAKHPREKGFLTSWDIPTERVDQSGQPRLIPWTIREPSGGSTEPEYKAYRYVVHDYTAFEKEPSSISRQRWDAIERLILESSLVDWRLIDITDFIQNKTLYQSVKIVIKNNHIVHFIGISKPNKNYEHIVDIISQYPDDKYKYSIFYVGNDEFLDEVLKKWVSVSEEFRDVVNKASLRAQ